MNIEMGTEVWYVINEDGVIHVQDGVVVEEISPNHYTVTSDTGQSHLHLSKMHWTRESAFNEAKSTIDTIRVRHESKLAELSINYMQLLIDERMNTGE